jgi:ElaB/YqjD/DUF883 family membrane-anchored ribosome-binding protein
MTSSIHTPATRSLAPDHVLDDDREPVRRATQDLADDVGTLTERGGALLRQRAHEAQERALQVRDSTQDLIQREPLKAVLVAAAAGALLMWLGSLLAHRRPR